MFDRTQRLNRRGSSCRDLPEYSEEDSDKVRLPNSLGSQAAWAAIFRTYATDYVLLFILAVITVVCEGAAPFVKVIYTKDDQELWKYSYPLHVKNTVPAWTVPLIATAGPLAVFGVAAVVYKPSRLEQHNLVLGLLASVFMTATATNLVKLGVGRPRPNFVARCWPDGDIKFSAAGIPECAHNAINPGEGRKSFPSGHTAWSTSGLAYLSFYLVGLLRCFDGSGHPMRLVVAGFPMSCAAWIGITRLQDYWHHWEDVLAGFLLGLTMAYLSYRQHYPPLMSSRSGEAYAATTDTAGETQRAGILTANNGEDIETNAIAIAL